MGADPTDALNINWSACAMSSDGSVIAAQNSSFETGDGVGCRWSSRTGEVVFELIPTLQVINCVSHDGSSLIGILPPNGDAARLDNNGTVQILGGLRPAATDDDGRVVSGQVIIDSFGGHAAVWSQQSGLVLLPVFSQSGMSSAGPMTADGSLIVGAVEQANVENDQCIWINRGNPIHLLDYIAPAHVDLTGWTDLNVRAINGDGSVFAGIALHNGVQRGFVLRLHPICGSADFNHDGDVGTDADINDFFSCLSGDCCPSCPTPDFNGDGDIGTDADIEAFFRVLAGGSC
jgi:hypothetical protein